MFFDELSGRPRWRRIAVLVLLMLVATAGGLAFIGWLMLREVGGPGPDPGKARSEVQRMYDRRWPGRIVVGKCRYVDDPEGSIFSWYDCELAVRCPRRVTFDVPRADSLNPLDYDPAPPVGRPTCKGQGASTK